MDEVIGRTLRGYEIRSIIGLGGFGTVYRAYQSRVSRDVAIKVISPNYASSADFIQSFEREAKLIARLEHPHIVPIIDFWRDPRGAYIVMRYLGGGSVETSLRKEGPWSVERTSLMLDQIAAGLAEAHRHHVIHQDIKVANILLDQQGNAYLSDFGIAKELDQSETPANAEQILSDGEEDDSGAPPTVHGSPEYMSPEQILRMSVDARTDIYSLGLVLYEVLTGEKAFNAPDDDALLRKQLYEKIPALAQKRPDLSSDIDQILQRATNKHPKNRYDDVLQMAREFRQAALTARSTTDALTAPFAPEQFPQDDETTEPVNPYKGLMAFQEGDAADFYGREMLVEKLYRRLLEPGDEARFLAVVGPSGSGKSSVVRAGLLPMLRKNAPKWFVVEMTPDTDPFAQLTDAVLRIATEPDYPYDEVVRRGVDGLRTALRHALVDLKRQLVLVIDQFEELFTLTQDETVRRLFIDSLLHALQPPDSQLRLIITLRADFLDRPLAYSGLSELLSKSKRFEMIPLMTAVELQHAIEKPAERAKLTLDDGLVSQMIADTYDQPNALPLLQYALTELYEKRDKKDGRLTLYAYKRNGGITGAIEARADGLLEKLSEEERRTARQLFLQLVNLGEGVEDTRRRIRLSTLRTTQIDQQALEKILDLFSQNRLITFDRDLENREPTVEIAHEALLKHWGKLRGWLNENRDALRIEQQLVQLAGQWLDQNKDASYLASGARLQQFEEIRGNPNIVLPKDVSEFLQASIQRRLRNQRLRTALLFTAITAALLFSVLFLFAQSQSERANAALNNLGVAQATTVAERNRADEESRISLSRELSIRALMDVSELDRRFLLSAAAVDIADTDAARNTLLTNLQNFSLLDRLLHGPITDLRSIAYSSDGRWIAGGGSDQRGYLWEASTGVLVDAPLQHSDTVDTVAFNSLSTLVATGGEDGVVRLWSVPDGELTASLSLETEIWRVVFSPDDRYLAVADDNGTIFLLDGTSLEVQARLEDHQGAVYALAFSPDGQLLASGGEDNQIRLWSVDDGEQTRPPLNGHDNWIWSLSFSPDGTLLASAGFDNTVRLWEVDADYSLSRTLQGHTDFVRAVVFSANGRLLATGGDDDRAVLWSVQTGQALSVIPFADAANIWSLAFKPDQSAIVIAGVEPVGQIWNLSQEVLRQSIESLPQPVRLMRFEDEISGDMGGDTGGLWLFGNTSSDPATVDIGWRWSFIDNAYIEKATYTEATARLTTAATLSKDGLLWASADSEGAVKIFDVRTGQQIGETLQVSGSEIYALAFDRDGTRLAVGDRTGQIFLWQRAVPGSDDQGWLPLEITLDGHLDRILTLTFSEDGRFLASGSRDSTVILWEFSGEAVAGTTLSVHTEGVMSLAFNSNASLLLSGGRDDMVALWDVSSRSLRQSLRSHTDWVTALAFDPEDQFFLSGSRDMTAILWSTREGVINPIGEPFAADSEISALAFSQEGRYLAVGTENGSVRIWQAAVEDWVAEACKIANRRLTEQEVETYLHGFQRSDSCQ